MRLRRSSAKDRQAAERGQSLIEFALVFPLFWIVLIGLIEFAFAFQAVLAVSYSSRNAVVIASEAGSDLQADCSILRSIDGDLGAPAAASQIQKVDIYWTDSNGAVKPGWTTTYTRSTSSTTSCTVNGVATTVPYAKTADGYQMKNRCSTRSGCTDVDTGTVHVGLDTVGVKVTYVYRYHTPYGSVLGGTGMTLERASEMRLEPYQ